MLTKSKPKSPTGYHAKKNPRKCENDSVSYLKVYPTFKVNI